MMEAQKFLKDNHAKVPQGMSQWTHFKGTKYRVVCCAVEEKTCIPVVVYVAMNGEAFTRPLDEFLGMHESGVKRFIKGWKD